MSNELDEMMKAVSNRFGNPIPSELIPPEAKVATFAIDQPEEIEAYINEWYGKEFTTASWDVTNGRVLVIMHRPQKLIPLPGEPPKP